MPVSVYVPAPYASIPRSYVRSFWVLYAEGATIARVDNTIYMHFIGVGFVFDTYITLNEAFVPWSSNVYSLDRIVVSEYSELNGAGPPIYSPYSLHAGVADQDGLPFFAIVYDPNNYPYQVRLPVAPSDYWLQLPP